MGRYSGQHLMLSFQRPVRWEDRLPLPRTHRLNDDGARPHLQYPTRPVLNRLQRELPDDAIALIALTAQDLYPTPDWSFVFGMADLRNRVGVVSLSRLVPAFWGAQITPAAQTRALFRMTFSRLYKWRLMKILVPEIKPVKRLSKRIG